MLGFCPLAAREAAPPSFLQFKSLVLKIRDRVGLNYMHRMSYQARGAKFGAASGSSAGCDFWPPLVCEGTWLGAWEAG